MSYQEKRIIASIINVVLTFGVYYAIVFQMYQNGYFNGPDATALLGKAILVLIVGSVILNIIVTIILNIAVAIREKDNQSNFIVDERDRLIELRGLQISSYSTGAGFVLAMLALALGQSVFLIFNLIISAFALGDLVGNIVMLRIYRRGF